MTISFADAAAQAVALFRRAGYPGADITVAVPAVDVLALQREPEVARAIVDHAMAPPVAAPRGRVLGLVAGVRVVVGGE